MRKNLKDLFYNLDMMKQKTHLELQNIACRNMEPAYYKKLLKELGDFQDLCAALNQFENSAEFYDTGAGNNWRSEK